VNEEPKLFESPLMRKLIILNCPKDDTRFTTYYGDFANA
jgi:hypothetical protein